MNSVIRLSDRITTGLHTPAGKVDGFKPLQVVAVLCCGVLRFFGSACFVAWLGFFLLWFFKIPLKSSSHQLPKAVKEFYWSTDNVCVFYM